MYYFFSSWGVAYSFIISWVVIVAGGWPRSKKLLFIVIYYWYVKISCTEIESLCLALCKCASKCTLNKNIESFLPLNCWLIHAHLAPNITFFLGTAPNTTWHTIFLALAYRTVHEKEVLQYNTILQRIIMFYSNKIYSWQKQHTIASL